MVVPELFAEGLISPGGIAFDDEESLFVAETTRGHIQAISRDGSASPFVNPGGKPEGIGIDDSGDMFVADRGRRHLILVSPDEAIEIYAHQCKGKRFIGPQYLCFSPAGDIVFTDPGNSSIDDPCGSIYSADLEGETSQLATGLAGPAGLVVSDDAGSLFVAEASTNRILCFAITDEGGLEEMEIFLQFEDGAGLGSMLFDTEGMLYVGRTGVGLTLADPEGKIVEEIALPGPEPTGMTFSGLDFDQLFIAEAQSGAIYCLQTRHPGQRPFVGPRSI